MKSTTTIGAGVLLAAMSIARPAVAGDNARINEMFVDGCALLATYDGSKPLTASAVVQQNAVLCELLVEAVVGVASESDAPRAAGQRLCMPDALTMPDAAAAIVSRRRSLIDSHPSADPAGIVLLALADAYACSDSD